MMKSMALVLLSTVCLGAQAYPIGIPGVYEPLLPRVEMAVTTPQLDDLMSPDEIAAEIGLPTQEEKWMNGDYDGLVWNVARTKQNLKNRDLQILVTKSNQQMQVFQNGRLIWTFDVTTARNRQEKAPSGKRYFSATRPGTFTIDWTTRMHRSNTWGGARMPFSMFFNGGIAIHGTTPDHYEELGKPPGKYFINSRGKKQLAGSGGCVRLHPDNAKKLYELVERLGKKNVAITIVE